MFSELQVHAFSQPDPAPSMHRMLSWVLVVGTLSYPVSVTSRLGKGREQGTEKRNGNRHNSKLFSVLWDSMKELIWSILLWIKMFKLIIPTDNGSQRNGRNSLPCFSTWILHPLWHLHLTKLWAQVVQEELFPIQRNLTYSFIILTRQFKIKYNHSIWKAKNANLWQARLTWCCSDMYGHTWIRQEAQAHGDENMHSRLWPSCTVQDYPGMRFPVLRTQSRFGCIS